MIVANDCRDTATIQCCFQQDCLNQREAHEEYCLQIRDRLVKRGIRAELYSASETLNKRIVLAQAEKVPYMLVAGGKEAEAGTVTVRRRNSKEQNVLSVDAFVESCAAEIAARA